MPGSRRASRRIIQAIAKGLGGGYQPIGAMLASGQIIETIRQGSGSFQHGHTYLAHPIACAAALEVQNVISDEGLLGKVRERGAQLERRLTERFGNHRHVGDIRGRGLFWAIELVADRATRKPFDPALKLNQRIKTVAFETALPVTRWVEPWMAATGIISCSRRLTSQRQKTSI